MTTILWVDDEIDHLRSHIRYLEKRGYRVLTAMSGRAALDMLSRNRVDLVLMDQMMVGLDGLQTVEMIRKSYHQLPVVMVTQSEEEELMDEALGRDTDDYLTKPVNPSQVLLAIKRILTSDRLRSERASEELMSRVGRLMGSSDDLIRIDDWISLYSDWMHGDVTYGSMLESDMKSVEKGRLQELAMRFSRFVEKAYPEWIASGESAPLMPQNFLERVVAPLLESSGELVLLVMDCMRLDQWLVMYSEVEKWFHHRLDFMVVNLPSATPYSRNALFAGLLPRDIHRFYRRNWVEEYGSPGLNRHEPEHLQDALARIGGSSAVRAEYVKLGSHEEGESFRRSLSQHLTGGFLAVVVSYLDHLTHGRSESEVLKDLAPDVRSFRELALSWFQGSFLKSVLKTLAARGATVVVTSDHGSDFCTRFARVKGARGMSSSVRFRVGHSLTAEPKAAVVVRQPEEWGLPAGHPRKSYVFARPGLVLMQSGMPRDDVRKFMGTFQHGGISIEEMIVPVATLLPKKLG